MYCSECGEKLTLLFLDGEGLVPYCSACGEYRFPLYSTAVSMVVTNRAKDKILLAKHKEQNEFILFAGYVKKGETAEKAVTREFKEETKLNTVKFKYMSSRYHEPRNVLMLNFLLMAEDGAAIAEKVELDEVKWFTFDEALQNIQKNSTAEFFLKNAIAELKKNNNVI
jgi:NAD+ diphosphatase